MTTAVLTQIHETPTETLTRMLRQKESLLAYLHERAPGDEWIPEIEELIDVIKAELCKRGVL
jgi:hypothetical protein